MHNIQWYTYDQVHCIVYRVQCTLCTLQVVQCTVYTLYTVQRYIGIMYSVQIAYCHPIVVNLKWFAIARMISKDFNGRSIWISSEIRLSRLALVWACLDCAWIVPGLHLDHTRIVPSSQKRHPYNLYIATTLRISTIWTGGYSLTIHSSTRALAHCTLIYARTRTLYTHLGVHSRSRTHGVALLCYVTSDCNGHRSGEYTTTTAYSDNYKVYSEQQ